MKYLFAEMGIGNGSFFSTEIEEGLNERRVSQFLLPKKISDYYMRIWIWKRVLVISTKDGIKIKAKDIKRFKFLLGIGGESE
ncbi:MAG: DUF3977 family protein [Candidatus Paceibacterota bacterium]|nr:MAG: DUF3977 family protein [Candidatus Paceibacterota bacterium]